MTAKHVLGYAYRIFARAGRRRWLQTTVGGVLRPRWQGSRLAPAIPRQESRCATDEFAAFLIQFLGGDEDQAQSRWWLSLRESHARFRISAAERSAWLKNMEATLEAAAIGEDARKALHQFFFHSSAYVIGKETAKLETEELGARWAEQRTLDECIAAIAAGHVEAAIALAPQFASRSSVFVGLLARMMQSRLDALVQFVVDAVQREPSLSAARFAGKTLLHFASAAGCLGVVRSLLQLGADPNTPDSVATRRSTALRTDAVLRRDPRSFGC